MPDIFALVTDLWENQSLQLPLVSLIESLGKALDAEFRPFLPTILPLILKVFDGELNDKRSATQIKVFDAFLTFGSNIEEYLHLVIPIIVRTPDVFKQRIEDGRVRYTVFSPCSAGIRLCHICAYHKQGTVLTSSG